MKTRLHLFFLLAFLTVSPGAAEPPGAPLYAWYNDAALNIDGAGVNRWDNTSDAGASRSLAHSRLWQPASHSR